MISYLLCLLLWPLSVAAAEPLCHYQTWDWNVARQKTENPRSVQKPRKDLSREEKGAVEGCSVCEEDQELLQVPGLPSVKICRKFRSKLEDALVKARLSGFHIESLVGYRVGRSKGREKADGLRSDFSNHSYGTALDINSRLNGLYDRCVKFGPGCRLRRGGEYRPGQPGTITKTTELYQALRAAGFLWGGELQGQQKDFMHFSLSGN